MHLYCMAVFEHKRSTTGQIDFSVRRHAGLQFVIGVLQIDLDPVDESNAFFVCFDAFWRELSPPNILGHPILFIGFPRST